MRVFITLLCMFLFWSFEIHAQAVRNRKVVYPDDIVRMENAAPANPSVKVSTPRNILIFKKSKGWQTPASNFVDSAFVLMGKKSKAFTVTKITDDDAILTSENLAAYDAILLNNTNELELNEKQTTTLTNFVKNGKGIFAFGCAISIQNNPVFADMMGGFCLGHPFQPNVLNTTNDWPIKIDDPTNPLMKYFDPNGFREIETIYQIYGPYTRRKLQTLTSLDVNDIQLKNTRIEDVFRFDNDFAVSWIREYGRGRIYFSQSTHTKSKVLFESNYLKHFLDAIQYVTGDLKISPVLNQRGRMYYPPQKQLSLNECLQKVADKNPVVRVHAVDGLANYASQTKIVLPVLLKSLRDSSADVKYFAAMSLGKLGKPAVEEVAKSLHDENPKVSCGAILTLKFAGAPSNKYLEEVISLSKSNISAVKIEAIKAIGKISTDKGKVMPILLECLKDTNQNILFATFEALGRLGTSAKEALPEVTNIIRTSKNYRIRRAATDVILSMSILPEAKDGIISLTGCLTQNWQLGMRTVAVFGKMGANAFPAVPSLIQLTKNGELEYRAYATLALGEIGFCSNDVNEVLRNLLNEKEPLIRYYAADALGKIGVNALNILLEMLQNKDWYIRLAACQSIESIGPKSKSALPEIQKLINDPDLEVRRAARTCFTRLKNIN